MIAAVTAVTVLSCGMVPAEQTAKKALGATRVVMNIVLPSALATSIRSREERPMPIRFAGQDGPEQGWLVTNAPANAASAEVVLGRVTQAAEGGLRMAWGKATKAGDQYTWLETMQGACTLAGEEVLK